MLPVIALVGRPNVGKSTLINRIVGEERVLAFDQPGTTRDAVAVPFEKDGTRYTLIDTAGVRRRSRVDEAIEKFSVVKTLQAIEEAHVVDVPQAHRAGHVYGDGAESAGLRTELTAQAAGVRRAADMARLSLAHGCRACADGRCR